MGREIIENNGTKHLLEVTGLKSSVALECVLTEMRTCSSPRLNEFNVNKV